MENRKKLLLSGLTAVIVCMVSALLLAQRTNVISLEDFFSSRSQQEKATLQEAENADEGGRQADTGKDIQQSKDQHLDPTPAPTGNVVDVDVTKDRVISVKTGDELTSAQKANGVIRITYVSLPDEILAWTAKDYTPHVGDVLRLTIPTQDYGDIPYELLLRYHDRNLAAGGSCVSVSMAVKGKPEARAVMTYNGSTIYLNIIDPTLENPRIFSIKFDAKADSYCIMEIDPARQNIQHRDLPGHLDIRHRELPGHLDIPGRNQPAPQETH